MAEGESESEAHRWFRRRSTAGGGAWQRHPADHRSGSRSAVLCHHVLARHQRPAGGGHLAGIAFCDLYAGSGAMGPEAASRGANPVLLVEADRRIAALAVRNARELGLPAKVRTSRVEALLRRSTQQPFDILFADPPYDVESAHLDDQLMAILLGGWIKPRGLVLVERSRRSPNLTWPAAFGATWARTYGETVVEFGAVDSLRATEGEL